MYVCIGCVIFAGVISSAKMQTLNPTKTESKLCGPTLHPTIHI